MSETRIQSLILNIRRDLHPDAKPFSTYIIAEMAQCARGWIGQLISSEKGTTGYAAALEEIDFYFEAIRYVRRRMDVINQTRIAESKTP